MVGGLGGFVLPIAFGALNDLTGVWTSCFMLLFVIVAAALLWMHFAILYMERRGPTPSSARCPSCRASAPGRGPRRGPADARASKGATPSPGPRRAAATALVVRELLAQRARRLGIEDEDAAVEELLAREGRSMAARISRRV